eukprot:UN12202
MLFHCVIFSSRVIRTGSQTRLHRVDHLRSLPFDMLVMLSCSYAGYVLSTFDEDCTDKETRQRLIKETGSRVIR